MAFLVPAVLVVLALVLASGSHLATLRKQKQKAKAAERAEASRSILIHSINQDRCVGCDACIAVCPTDVLENISNKAQVVRFGDCIQCEQCMWACPTQALVMHKDDEEPPPIQVPSLDPYYQTDVAGMYLIGEVSGKPLVKNAANAGRAVIEHMVKKGLRSDDHAAANGVDVLIVGSGPGGLSAALTCLHRGLSYIIIEKDQAVASTIAHYPKGKEVMVEPYSVKNLSFLPVFDSRKEDLWASWNALIGATGLAVRRGESVEQITREGRLFHVRTTAGIYLAQKVVLATGNRGKPRTLSVPGENLPKVSSMLADPDEHTGQDTLVVGGGDSALEAACALADAGSRVILSYRGKTLTRANGRNRDKFNEYVRAGKISALLGSAVRGFGARDVTLTIASGETVRYANHAAFVLIGADAPIEWLKKQGVTFTERPHWYALGPTDAVVESILGQVAESPIEWRKLAATVLGRPVDRERAASPPAPVPVERAPIRLPIAAAGEARRGPPAERRSPLKTARIESVDEPRRNPAHELERPMSLEDFAKAASERRGMPGQISAPRRNKRVHTAEITRLLRSLHDEGARLADEDSVDMEIASADLMEVSNAVATLDSIDRDVSFPEATPPQGASRIQTPLPLPAEPIRLTTAELATPAVILGLPKRPPAARARARRVAAPSFSEEPTKVAAAGELESLRNNSRQLDDDTLPKIIVEDTIR